MVRNRFQKHTTLWLALLTLVAGLAGCADMNDDSSNRGDTIRVPLAELQQQMGLNEDINAAILPPADTGASTAVRTLVVGAVVVRSRTADQGPYTAEVPVGNIGDALEQDITDSGNNLQVVPLTGADVPDEIEIILPPTGADKWQIMAVGFSESFDQISKVSDDNIKKSAAYFGFHPQFLKTGGNGEVVTVAGQPAGEITLRMTRACLADNPPLGCYQYDGDRLPRGTTGVEVLGIYADGVLQALRGDFTYPVVIRNLDQIKSFNVLGAPRNNELSPAIGTAARITVRASHQLAAGKSAACLAATTVEALEQECGYTEFATAY